MIYGRLSRSIDHSDLSAWVQTLDAEASLPRIGLLVESSQGILNDGNIRRKLAHHESNDPGTSLVCGAEVGHRADGGETVMDEPVFFGEMIQNATHGKKSQTGMSNSVRSVVEKKDHQKCDKENQQQEWTMETEARLDCLNVGSTR